MRTRIAVAVMATTAALALSACSSSGKDSAAPAAATTTAAPTTTSAAPATVAPTTPAVAKTAPDGLPTPPDPEIRQLFLEGVAHTNPDLSKNPDKTIMAARQQCASLNNGDMGVGGLAAKRFSTPAHQLSDSDGLEIDMLLRTTVCPTT